MIQAVDLGGRDSDRTCDPFQVNGSEADPLASTVSEDEELALE
jgi:hypothetical protein